MGTIVDPLLDPSGRPPDPLVQLEAPIVLERPGSPTALEDQRNPKKSKGSGTEQGVIAIDEEDMVMETDINVVSDGSRESVAKEDEGATQQGDTAIGKTSYASVVSQGIRRAAPGKGEEVLDPNSVVVLDEDCIISDSGEYPSIKFSARVHDQIDRSMRNVVIVRLLGRNIGYGTLLNRLHALWKPKGEIQLIDLENNYFLVRLEDMRDYEVVLTEGPWTIFGNYLTVQPWSRSFTTDEKYPSQVIVWVRLPGLPYRYYCKALFRRIAQVVGKVVKVDYNTEAGERGKFARLAITVDLNKPLTPCIGIDNFVQKLEYEGLTQICFACGTYGHSREACNLNKVPHKEAATMEVNDHASNRDSNKSELYGPWMVARDRRRRPMVPRNSGRNVADVGGATYGSRFAVLNANQNSDQMVVDGMVTEQDINAHLEQSELCDTMAVNSGGVQDRQVGGSGSAAYRSSSPGRRSKVTGNMIPMDSSLDVIPLVGGSSVAINSHVIHNAPGSHRAISIHEPNSKDKGVRIDDRHNGRGKVGVSSPNRVLLSDWVQTTSQQIELEADSNRGNRNAGGLMGEDGREAISIKQVSRFDALVQGGTNDKEGGGGDLPL
ncbi:hypothetical protein GQ457_16G008840 [Hibiscus cannabinus]